MNREKLNERDIVESKNDNGKKKGSVKLRLLILFLILIVLGAGAVGYWYKNIYGFESTDDAFIAGNRISLGAKMLGRISALNADEGDKVEKGQLLVALDDSDLQAQQIQAEANLNLVQQSIILAKVSLKKAKEDFDRSSNQFKDHIIPREQYDHARQALDFAQAQLAIEEAREKTAKAQIQIIRTQIQNTRIIAPVSGIVAKKWSSVGDVVQSGQTIFTIYDPLDVWVEANFEETKIKDIHKNDNVEILVDAYSGRPYKGHVDFIGAAAASQFSLIPPNNASGNFTKVTQRVPVKIVFEKNNFDGTASLLPGMSVEVKVKVN